jgi:hypothetical protein
MVEQTIKIIKIHYRLYIKAISPLKNYSREYLNTNDPKYDLAMAFGQKTNLELLAFWTLSIIQYSKKLDLFPSGGGETSTLLGPARNPECYTIFRTL